MKNTDEEHYTINMQTHYTIQYRDKTCTWVGDVGKIKYYNSITEAEAAIQEVFTDGLNYVDRATIIEWKRTPVLVKRNIKPVSQSKTTFDVEAFNRLTKEWYVRRHEFEKLSDAEAYVQSRHFRDDWDDQFRIVQRDVTIKTSII